MSQTFSLSLFSCFHPFALPCREKAHTFPAFSVFDLFPCEAVCSWCISEGRLGSGRSIAVRPQCPHCLRGCTRTWGSISSPALALPDPDPQAAQGCVLSSALLGTEPAAAWAQSPQHSGLLCPRPTWARFERAVVPEGPGLVFGVGSAVGRCWSIEGPGVWADCS